MKDEIKIPTGYEFSHVESGVIKLKAIRPIVRPFKEIPKVISYHDVDSRFATSIQAKAAKALSKLTISLADLQQEPIVWDGAMDYHCIVLNMKGKLFVDLIWELPHLLAFRDKEIATEFLEVHRDDIIAAAPLLWGVEIGGGEL